MLCYKHILAVEQIHLTVLVKIVRAALAVELISSDIYKHKDDRDYYARDTSDPADLFKRSDDFRLAVILLDIIHKSIRGVR